VESIFVLIKNKFRSNLGQSHSKFR